MLSQSLTDRSPGRGCNSGTSEYRLYCWGVQWHLREKGGIQSPCYPITPVFKGKLLLIGSPGFWGEYLLHCLKLLRELYLYLLWKNRTMGKDEWCKGYWKRKYMCSYVIGVYKLNINTCVLRKKSLYLQFVLLIFLKMLFWLSTKILQNLKFSIPAFLKTVRGTCKLKWKMASTRLFHFNATNFHWEIGTVRNFAKHQRWKVATSNTPKLAHRHQ